MTHSAPSLEIDLSWRMREHEARLLTELLRTSRLTLLYGEAGVGRSELLAGGVLPQLRRRASDAVGDEFRESRVVVPFPDRRSRRAGRSSTRIAERVIVFDAWGANPLAALKSSILETLPSDTSDGIASIRLAGMLSELAARVDAHFLIVMDRFESFWNPEVTDDDRAAFVEQFSEAINRHDVRANFLLSVGHEVEDRLGVFRQRIAGFDDATVRLLKWQSGKVDPLPILRDVAEAPARPAVARARKPADPPRARARSTRVAPPKLATPAPIKTESVYAFIESTLSQTASVCEPWHESEGVHRATAVPRGPWESAPDVPAVSTLPPVPAKSDVPRNDPSAPDSSQFAPEERSAPDPMAAMEAFRAARRPRQSWVGSAVKWIGRFRRDF